MRTFGCTSTAAANHNDSAYLHVAKLLRAGRAHAAAQSIRLGLRPLRRLVAKRRGEPLGALRPRGALVEKRSAHERERGAAE